MKKIKLSLVLLALAFWANTVSAETCKSLSEQVLGSSGYMKLSGSICLANNSYASEVNGVINVTYSDYTTNELNIDGQFILTYSSNSISPSATSLALNYNGGPVNYQLAGQTYKVEFNDLNYIFDGNMKQQSEDGNILLNGVILEAVKVPYKYVKVF